MMFGVSSSLAADHGDAPLFFSDQLNDGDHFEWGVRFYENGLAVDTISTDPEDDSPPFVNDSKVELDIFSNVHSIDVNGNNTEADLNSAFNLRIDGTSQPLMDNGSISQWLLIFLNPTDLFLTGTTEKTNYFHYLVDNSETHFLINSTGVIDSSNESYRVIEERTYNQAEDNEDRYVREEAEYELGRGALRYFSHYEESYDAADAVNGTIDAQFFLMGDSGGGDGDDFFNFSSFSASLNTGDIFTWEVLTLDGTNVNTAYGEVGSIMQIEVIDEPENFDIQNETSDPDDYFLMSVDGAIVDINDMFEFEDFINIIFPTHFDYDNGTVIDNFFVYLDDMGVENVIELEDGEIVQVDQAAGTALHQVTRTEDNGYRRTEDVTWDIETGVMLHAYLKQQGPDGTVISEVEFDRIESGDPVNTGSNTDETTDPVGLPGMTYFWAISALIAIPILRRKN